jgi:hypothetical protein
MTIRLALLPLVLTAFLVAGGAAHAQSPLASDTWTITPFLGVAFDPDADPSLAIGAAVGLPITASFAVEAELGHVLDMVPDDSRVDASLTTVHGALLYFFDSEFVLTPYLAGGIGVGKFSVNLESPPVDSSRTEVGFNLGGGVVYQIAAPIWLRGDFRYFKHIDDLPSAWRLSAGLTFRFGN